MDKEKVYLYNELGTYGAMFSVLIIEDTKTLSQDYIKTREGIEIIEHEIFKSIPIEKYFKQGYKIITEKELTKLSNKVVIERLERKLHELEIKTLEIKEEIRNRKQYV